MAACTESIRSMYNRNEAKIVKWRHIEVMCERMPVWKDEMTKEVKFFSQQKPDICHDREHCGETSVRFSCYKKALTPIHNTENLNDSTYIITDNITFYLQRMQLQFLKLYYCL